MSVSWRTRFSVRTRYEIASAVAVFGLILSLCGSAAVYAVFTSCIISDLFIQGCISLGLVPIPVAILSLILGIVILLYGIYLLPQQREDFFLPTFG
ncbi:hypothetical protein BOKEGFJH_00915 [Chlamydia avium]|nr:hypothetical protein CP10881SC42_0374 [Chlamydia avium]VVT43369.1 hypothetical protein BOKEGFJH_00915 [Chlamydia avium]